VSDVSSLRLVGTLGLSGLLSGLALVGVYELTLPTILENKAEALRNAVFQVVPGATTMQRLERTGQALAVKAEGDGDAIYAAYDDAGGFQGYAIPAKGPGFQDNIAILYGYRPGDKRIVGMAVLESRETPGLGDKIYKDRAFQENFVALSVEPEIVAVKKGEKKNPNEVDCITGATISSKAIVSILNGGNERWLDMLPGAAPALEGRDAP
jgi:electron transport complex protein RnfG